MLGSQLVVISTVLALIALIFMTARTPAPANATSRIATTAVILARIEIFESMDGVSCFGRVGAPWTTCEGTRTKRCRAASKLIRATHALTGAANAAAEEHKSQKSMQLCAWSLGQNLGSNSLTRFRDANQYPPRSKTL